MPQVPINNLESCRIVLAKELPLRAGKALIYGWVVLLVIETFAAPSYGFWFFHKHKSQQQPATPTYSNYYSNQTVIYRPPGYVGHKGRRLVPAHLYSNMPNDAENSAQPKISTESKANIHTENISPVDFSVPTVVVVATRIIKVGIGLNLTKATIAVLDGAQIIDNSNGQVIANLPGQSQWLVSRTEDQIVFEPRLDYYNAVIKVAQAFESGQSRQAIQTVAYYPANTDNASEDLSIVPPPNLPANMDNLVFPVVDSKCSYTIKAANGGLLALNDRPYRGDLLIQNNKEKFNIINIVNLEDYLLGVVPSEMPSLWPDEALKAQAIAARSYAVANLGKHGKDGYDVKDNIEDQVYLGTKAETEMTNQAVSLTNGLIIRYEGQPVCAYFHSAGGGTTEAAENVWHKSLPYLKAVPDFDQDSPMYNWTKNFTAEQAENALPADKELGKIISICVSERSPAGRAVRLVVFGSKNACIISGEATKKVFQSAQHKF